MFANPRLRSALVAVLTLVILALLLSFVDVGRVVELVSSANPIPLVLALLVMVIMLVLKAVLWQAILKLFDYNIPVSRCFSVEMATKPILGITPSRSGELAKVYYFRDELPGSVVGISVVYERALDAAFLCLFGFLGIITFVGEIHFELPSGIVVGVALASLLIFSVLTAGMWTRFRPRILAIARTTIKYLATLRRRPKLVFWTVTLSFGRFVLSIVQVVLFFYALGIELPWLFAVTRIPVPILVGLLPVTVAGMGTRDAAFIALFSDFGAPEALFTVGLVFTTIRYWLPALAGVPFIYFEGRRDE